MIFIKPCFALMIALLSFNCQAENILRLATTTSTENSGLLSVLNPVFEKRYNCRLDVLAVGTGKALKLGENGDVDVVFVHAPNAERVFVEKGYGIDRTAVMHNDFILVGSPKDSAHVKQAQSVEKAFNMIASAKAEFISRGDDSGTHKKEKSLWQLASINPKGVWYIQAGQSMGAILKIADEKQAYTLTDRGTYLSFQDHLDLTIVYANEPPLHNPYHIMAVNPQKHQHVQYPLAKNYIDFVTGFEGQALIANFRMKGQSLFYPDAIKENTVDETQVIDEKPEGLFLKPTHPF